MLFGRNHPLHSAPWEVSTGGGLSHRSSAGSAGPTQEGAGEDSYGEEAWPRFGPEGFGPCSGSPEPKHMMFINLEWNFETFCSPVRVQGRLAQLYAFG